MTKRRRKRRKTHEEVELNLAAMLDMAFQLLTFFILTFKPAPVEVDLALRLPPPQPITATGKTAGADTSNTDPIKGLDSLIISAYPNKSGEIESMAIGDAPVGMGELDARLKSVLNNQGSPFQQVLIQVGSGLRYDALMRIIDICAQQKLADGEKLKKLSFVEMPSAT